MAHRGGAKLAPENTMAAFRQAVDDWDADILELDVHCSSDGQVVVIHDDTVDRTTDGSGTVAKMPWDELRDLDAGARFCDLDGRQSWKGKGVRLPLLAEVLESLPRTRLNVELKTATAALPVVELVRAYGAKHRVLVAAGEESFRRAIRGYPGAWGASRSQIRAFWLLHRVPGLGRWYLPRADVLQIPERRGRLRVLTPALIRAAHESNIPVHVWTVDDPVDMRRLLRWKVDGIQTDRPDLLAQVLTEIAGRPPPPGLMSGEEGVQRQSDGQKPVSNGCV